MKKVTALRAGKGRRQRVNVFLDGRFAFSLDAEVVVKGGLRVGQDLTEGQLEALAGADGTQRCLEAAGRYLGYRLQSESELAEKLRRRGFADG
ncbi:MAG: regulatory protein RecX, partial [Chloroflexota bacterium]